MRMTNYEAAKEKYKKTNKKEIDDYFCFLIEIGNRPLYKR